MVQKIILVSQSPYRKQLLSRLAYPFESISPSVNEEELKSYWLNQGVSPQAMAMELAKAKAQSVYQRYAGRAGVVLLGSDQLLSYQGEIFGKSGSLEKAFWQLQRLQGQTHELITAMCLIDALTGHTELWYVTARMSMYALSEAEIWDYVKTDQAIDCAGSYKLEKHGISLFSQIECEDWTAIEGLGLIGLQQKLKTWC